MGKKCPPCKKGAPGWMVTFGDMMALLLTFFVLLLSFAQLDIVKFEDASGSLQDAFGVQTLQQVNPMPTGETMMATDFQQEIVLVHLKEKLQVILENETDNGEAEVIELENGFMVRLTLDALFDEDLVVRKAIKPKVQQIATLLAGVPNMVFISGHTDNQPPNPNGVYKNNWAVSAAAAAAMVNYLAKDGGVEASRMQARGLSEYSPVASNDTEEGAAKNRRIEILISKETPPVEQNKFIESTDFIKAPADDNKN
ncbi:MAG: flagellar motor protein MotB [Magnetococcales bacterium]|nr:flagellar motor protein MotB [Magnetococcales bacterium]